MAANPVTSQPTPYSPSPPALEYTKASEGCRPAIPFGVQRGIEYVASPVDDTAKDPLVRPTATPEGIMGPAACIGISFGTAGSRTTTAFGSGAAVKIPTALAIT